MGDKMSTELSLIDDPNIPPYRRLYAEDVARVFNCTVPTVTDMKAKGVVPPATYREGKRDVWTVGQIRDWLICRFDPEALWTVAPDYARNAHRDDLEPVKAVEGRRALTFMHGSPVIGYVVDDEECGRVIWREPATETNLPITSPVLCLLASKDEEPWEWRKSNN